MNLTKIKQFIENTLIAHGYDVSSNRIAKNKYTGKKIAFVHIAKCGGISIDTALRACFANPKQRRIDRDFSLLSSMSSFKKEINSIDSACDFSEYHAYKLQNLFNQFLALNWQYVSGHVAINSNILSQYRAEYAFITMLRDPIERFISNYIFNKLTNSQQYMLPNKHSTDDIVQEAKIIINSRRGWQMANIPTMCITGSFPKDIEHAKLLNQTFEENIKQFSVVGFLSQTNLFTQKIETLTGRNIHIQHKNAANNINNRHSEKIRTTLKTFFYQQNTKLKLNELCKFESINYQNALNKYG